LNISYCALGTVNGTAKFVSSSAVGLMWTAVSQGVAFAAAAGLMMADAHQHAIFIKDNGSSRQALSLTVHVASHESAVVALKAATEKSKVDMVAAPRR
jgi:hypothetical protein